MMILMVKRNTILGLGIIGVFLAFGGASLVKPAIEETKKLKNDIAEKLNDRKGGSG